MCRASEAFKIEVLKNAYKIIWAKNLNVIVKDKHNIGLKDLKFQFLAVVGQFKLENIPCFNFLPNDGRAMFIYNFLLLRPAHWLYFKDHKTAPYSFSSH